MKCTDNSCPGNVLEQEHAVGDNACGFLNATPADPDAAPVPKNRRDRYFTCRRPYCARPHLSAERRNKHEADATHPNHRKPNPAEAMTFICDWEGHGEAIAEAGFCSVCQ